MDRLIALFAFAIFAIFLGILSFEVMSWDLKAIILLTLAAAGYDFWTSIRKAGK